MSSASKQKGSSHERNVVQWLIDQGWIHAERRIAGDTKDRGDIAGIPKIVFECKNEKRIDLAQYMRELQVEVDNDNAHFGAAVVKKRGTTDVGEYYAVMPMAMLAGLLKKAGY